jgi:hypothetical protein
MLGIDGQLVAAHPRHHNALASRVGRQRLAQPRDLDVQSLGRRGLSASAEQLVHQPVDAQRLVGVDQEQTEKRPLPAPAERDGATFGKNLDWTEDAEIHESHWGATKPILGATDRASACSRR